MDDPAPITQPAECSPRAPLISRCFHLLRRSGPSFVVSCMMMLFILACGTSFTLNRELKTKIRLELAVAHERDTRLDRFLAAVSKPVTPHELELLIGAMPPDYDSAEEVAIRAWIDDKDRSLWPPLEVFARRTRELAQTHDKPAPAWLESYRADEPKNRERLIAAAAAVNDGVDKLYQPLVPFFDGQSVRQAQNPVPAGETSHARELVEPALVGLLARTKQDPSSQFAAVSLLHDFGLTVPIESFSELSEQARLNRRPASLRHRLRNPDNRSLWQEKFGAVPDEHTLLVAIAQDKAKARWIIAQDKAKGEPDDANEVTETMAIATQLLQRENTKKLRAKLGEPDEPDGLHAVGIGVAIWVMATCAVFTGVLLTGLRGALHEAARGDSVPQMIFVSAVILGAASALPGAILGGAAGIWGVASEYGWSSVPLGYAAQLIAAVAALAFFSSLLGASYPAMKSAPIPSPGTPGEGQRK